MSADPLARFVVPVADLRWRCPRRWLKADGDADLPAGLRGQRALVDGLDVLAASTRAGRPHHVEVTSTDARETAAAITALLQARGLPVARIGRPHEALLRGRGDTPGLLAVADGGVVVLDAADLVMAPGSWGAVREAMELGDVTRQPEEEALPPPPDTARISVVVVGNDPALNSLRESDRRSERLLYRRLERLSDLPLTAASVGVVVGILRDQLSERELGDASEGALAELVEHAVRRARRGRIATDLHREVQALFEARLARPEGALERRGVRATLARIRERRGPREAAHRRRIGSGQLQIATEGGVVGVVNGLMVYGQSRQSYAMPGRITARVAVGRQGLINVERESKLSGRSFDKGVYQLAGFLRSLYGQVDPLGLAATLTFEQSYGRVDGDSATLAEAVAVLSCLSDLPVRQDVAVSGAINPRGDVLPVGSATLKAEGWFATCRGREVTGGVILPRASVPDLQVSEEVRRAVEAGRFTVYAVDRIDDALEILLGRPAGAKPSGGFARGSVYARAGHRARAMSQRLYPPRKPPARASAQASAKPAAKKPAAKKPAAKRPAAKKPAAKKPAAKKPGAKKKR